MYHRSFKLLNFRGRLVHFMYNEKYFKITILLTKIRRYLFIFFFVILGLVGAYVLSEFLTEIVKVEQKIATLICENDSIPLQYSNLFNFLNKKIQLECYDNENKNVFLLDKINFVAQLIKHLSSIQPFGDHPMSIFCPTTNGVRTLGKFCNGTITKGLLLMLRCEMVF